MSPLKLDDTLTESSNSHISESSLKTDSDKQDGSEKDNNGVKLAVDWEEEINVETKKSTTITTKIECETKIKSISNSSTIKSTKVHTSEPCNEDILNTNKLSNELLNYYTLLKAYYDNYGNIPQSDLSNMFASNRLLDFARMSNDSTNEIKRTSIPSPRSSTPHQKLSPVQNININVNNIDKVSINVNKSNNNLKISCKTTPPKKRYSQKCGNSPKSNIKATISSVESSNYNNTSEYSTSSKNILIPDLPINNDIKNSTNEIKLSPTIYQRDKKPFVKFDEGAITNPITSTYLNMTRSLGLSDDEALKLDQVVSDDIDYLKFDINKYL